MKRIFAALAAALCCVSGAATMTGPTVDQAVIEGEATPQKLSEFGFGMTTGSYRPIAAFGYTLRTPLFSDYADKQRFVYIPQGREARVVAGGTIEFPVGTVLFKSFGWADHNGGKPVETRLLIHRTSGWVALPYIWDADGKDATLALGGRRVLVMANRHVEIFDNVFEDNGTANVMIVGYRYEHKDPKYQPLPKDIVVRDNQHGKAGYAPKFAGGDMIAAAMGGSIPPVLWDGSGDAIVLDKVGVLSLNLPDVKTPQSEAKPSPADLSKGTPPAALPAIKLPDAMEAKVR